MSLIRKSRPRFFASAVSGLALWSGFVFAQISPEEHASHHPGASASPGASPGPGMMGEMGKMMEGMHGTPPKQLYPTLMSLPTLSSEQRQKVEQQADERIRSGTALMTQALDELAQAQPASNYAAMHNATSKLHEGMTQLDTGIAAKNALAAGKAPSAVALDWFRREMNLSVGAPSASHQPIGIFHIFTMVLLIAFAIAMLVLYFLKMRRAASLFGRIEGGKGPPPPGSAPPLSGKIPPSGDQPPDNKPPQGGGSPRPTPPAGGGPAAIAGTSEGKAPQSAAAVIPPAISNGSPRAALTANWQGQLRVDSIVPETSSVKTVRLLPSGNGRFLPFTFVPGQFLNISFWIGGGRMNRSYSISSSPTQRKYVELTVRREPRGAVSRHIDDLLKVGDTIEAGGPMGKFTFAGVEGDSIVLISGGVGITPMMSITRYLTERSWPGEIFFIFSGRTPADIIFKDELATLQRRNPKLHLEITISKAEGTDWQGHRGRITKEWLTQIVPDIPSRRIHLCGPPSMMDATEALLAELRVPPEHVKTEKFGTPRPAPAAPGVTAKRLAPATGPLVTFAKSHKAAKIRLDLKTGDSPPKQSILELSEELGIGIDFSCRVGTCGVCKTKMTSGEVEMSVQDALDEDDKANGIILACQAKPITDVVVEA